MSSGLFDTAFVSINELRRGLDSQALKIVAETQYLIAQLNKDQLKHGLNSKGEKITPKYRSSKYARAKNSRNSLAGLGTPDLFLTGSFQDNFYVRKEGKGFTLFSSDKKASMLVEKYGDIFELTPDNEGYYNLEILLPRLEKWILNNLKI